MGRKRWWRGGLLELLLMLCFLNRAILGDGQVGCLFSKNLCDTGTESCYNDLAFGRCIPLYTDKGIEDLYQYNLEVEELELLRLQLERLEADGYKWPHPYTQCIMQNSLLNLRYRLPNDLDFCRYLRLRKNDHFINDEDDKVDDEKNVIRPVAVVKFTPSEFYPHGDYADELYYPPEIAGASGIQFSEDLQSTSLAPMYQSPSLNNGIGFLNEEIDPYKTRRKSKRRTLEFIDDDYYQPQIYQQSTSATLSFPEYMQMAKEVLMKIRDEEQQQEEEDEERNFVRGRVDLDFLNNEQEINENKGKFDNEDHEKTFTRKYRKLRQRALPEIPKSLSLLKFTEPISPKWTNEYSKEMQFDDEKEEQDFNENISRDDFMDSLPDLTGLYTEGGIILPLRRDDVRAAGFKRRERLDVKKPGPPFATNNYAFKSQFPPSFDEENQIEDSQDDKILYPPQSKKELSTSGQKMQDSWKIYKNVDLDHVYIDVEEPINIWMTGQHIVNETEKLAGLSDGDLRDVRVGNKEVTFKVGHNKKNYTASDIVKEIERFRSTLEEMFGVKIIRAGIGDKAKLPAMFEVRREMSSSMFGAVVAMGVAAAAAAATVILMIARRHAKSRAKLAGLTTPDPEASKDYQELCRARMQAKQPTDKPDSPRVFPLISRVSESNNSPSNRSSTSSWGEEPALTNMDISTGHMVLSYMEGHLKNQDRLDEEWLGICAYEAEPCSTAVAEAEGNVELNRPGASLPYDHSRVILNDLANINNSDYINASTITDHDPRNPAYIATQGALQETASDFWQLVWEQGSVVIVMLTRLTEEGKGMCYRYWPGEGSELYHIYEVHLVSEHIWCDDYLVRSFYLKNLRTGETRTVTQFHFLSWPENGVPHSTKALLEFRRKVNKSYRGRSCPIVIHCSDGAGRTGTYCLIDMVLNRMAKGTKEIDIAATLEHIRDQRPGMVSTKQQFEFVLMAVAEEVHAILKALPIPPEKSSAATVASSSVLSSSNSEQQ